MKDKKIKRIPYGLANYERVVKKNCYYKFNLNYAVLFAEV